MSALSRRRVEVLWTVLFVVIMASGLAVSEGEPVCEGPFILGVDDSFPPQCDSPLIAAPYVVSVWAIGLAMIVIVRMIGRYADRPLPDAPQR